MSVKRIREAPRITRPFSDESWARLDQLGEQVDADLKAGDVRLTMGGEPTFVSVDDLESPEWNIAAVGPTKRGARRRSDPPPADALRAGRPAALRAGQMVSRRKPAALGVRPLLAQGRRADLEEFRPDRRHRGAAQGAHRGCRALRGRHREETRRRFRVRPAGVRRSRATGCRRKPACRPMSIPADSKLADPEERARMARVFDQGLNMPKGFVLPIQRWNADAANLPRAGRASAGNCGAAICS